MNAILKTILSLSFSGSLLIIVLLLLKPLFKNRMSQRWQYYIWLVVILRLLLPFTPETSPIGLIFQKVDQSMMQIEPAPTKVLNTVNPLELQEHKQDEFVTQREETKAESIFFPQLFISGLLQHIWLIWLGVALFLLIRKIRLYRRLIKCIKSEKKDIQDEVLLNYMIKIKAKFGVKQSINLSTNELVFSPMLYGFFKPHIVLPTSDLSPTEFTYTVSHELIHFKHKDMFYKWLVQLVLCLHWFNPLLYIMSKEIGKACELACDESLIKEMNDEELRAYGNTLLNAIRIKGSYNETLASLTLNGNKTIIKERLESIMNYHKKTKWVVACSIFLTTTFAFGATAIGAYTAPITKSNTTEPKELITSTNYRVVQEDNIYFIYCDDATESHKPISSATEGSINFVLVHKDSYTAIGPFNKTKQLYYDVKEQCATMEQEQIITQADTDMILDTAINIQAGANINSSKEVNFNSTYAEHGISKENGAYYYQNERVHILQEVTEDLSLRNLNVDGKGSIDLQVDRDANGNILKIVHLTQTEAEEILQAYDIKVSDLTKK